MKNLQQSSDNTLYKIKVSIVVPIYNTDKMLIRCINSLYNQSHENIEIILVDDGSEKKTADLCDEISQEKSNVIVYHKLKGGVSSARNYGIERATGEYIFFADSDDYVEPNMIESLLKRMIETNAEIVIAGYFFDTVTKNNEYQSIEVKAPNELLTKEMLIERMVKLWDDSLMYNVWNKLFNKRTMIMNNIFFDEKMTFNEDREFVRRYILCVNKVAIINRSFYHYVRENGQSATAIYREDKLKVRKEEYHNLCNFFYECNIWNEEAREYVSREHFERVVACVEELYHFSNLLPKERTRLIRHMVLDNDTQEVLKFAKPKSRKMKLISMLYKGRNILGIRIVSYFIYIIKENSPALFYKLRQSR